MTDTIAHYTLWERIGAGGLGEVYRARDTRVGRTVALKILPDGLLPDQQHRERFLRDARAAAALSHPNIATLFDLGEDGGRNYLAYEYVQGSTLRQQIAGRRMNSHSALETAIQLADALAEAHSRDVVHTDLRPENVLVTPKGSAKILDFGMAAWTRGGAARARAASPAPPAGGDAEIAAYVSPEQAIGAGVDARSDLFSLGVIVYEMLTGRNPFLGSDVSTTLTNISGLTPPPVAATHPELPRELDAILSRALAKPVDGRQQSAAALAAEFRRVGAMLDVRAGGPAPGELLPLEDEGGGAKWWLAGAAAMALGGAVIWWFWK